MSQINLPKKNQVGANEFADVEDNDLAIVEVVNGDLDNANLSGAAGITRANLAAESKPVRWYTPKIISAEESRTNVAYGTLTTADEIKEVVVPENGLIELGYVAEWKESVEEAASAAVFIGSNQLAVAISTGGALSLDIGKFTGAAGKGKTNTFALLHSATDGLNSLVPESGAYGGHSTTGQVLGVAGDAGTVKIFGVAAGTYNLSVQYKASSGTVTAKNRKLWVAVFG